MGIVAGCERVFYFGTLPKRYHLIIYFFVANLLLLYLCRVKKGYNYEQTKCKTTAEGHAVGQCVPVSRHLR